MFERTYVRPFLFLLVGYLSRGNGFVVGPQRQYPPGKYALLTTSNLRSYTDNQGDDDSNNNNNNNNEIRNNDIIDVKTNHPDLNTHPLESGSHSELMYTLGINLARQLGDIRPLVEDGDELVHVAKGLLDTVVGRLTEDQQKTLLASRGRDLNALITERANNIRKRLEEDGRKMLQEMESTDGVICLDSGVCVHILEQNESGMRPTSSSTVRVHYHGSLPDGTVFDSTTNSDPIVFALRQVIPGWRDGLLQLREGETAMIGIPPEQAYGEEGTPDGKIPGGSTLFFKIQLLEVLSGGIGGSPLLLGADGKPLSSTTTKKSRDTSTGLLGMDGKPLS